jgi:hypothetical protein
VHSGGFDLALTLRKLVGIGKPRRSRAAFACIFAWFGLLPLYAWPALQTGCGFHAAQQEPAITP